MKKVTSHFPNSMTEESVRLRELIAELGLPLRRLPEVMSLGYEDCLNWWSHKIPVEISSSHFGRLMEILDINENQLFDGTYDKELARNRLFGANKPLPDRYLQNQNSYLRTSAHIIKYVVLTRGQLFADQVLRSLNISPTIYKDLHMPINLTYFSDLLETLEKRGFSRNELDALSSVMFLSMHETGLGNRFKGCESYADVFKTLSQNFDYFDCNFDYSGEFVGRKFILKTVLPVDHHEHFKGQEANLHRLMRYRHILIAWLPHLSGMAPLFPRAELKQSNGTLRAHYEIDLLPVKRPSSLQLL